MQLEAGLFFHLASIVLLHYLAKQRNMEITFFTRTLTSLLLINGIWVQSIAGPSHTKKGSEFLAAAVVVWYACQLAVC